MKSIKMLWRLQNVTWSTHGWIHRHSQILLRTNPFIFERRRAKTFQSCRIHIYWDQGIMFDSGRDWEIQKIITTERSSRWYEGCFRKRSKIIKRKSSGRRETDHLLSFNQRLESTLPIPACIRYWENQACLSPHSWGNTQTHQETEKEFRCSTTEPEKKGNCGENFIVHHLCLCTFYINIRSNVCRIWAHPHSNYFH